MCDEAKKTPAPPRRPAPERDVDDLIFSAGQEKTVSER